MPRQARLDGPGALHHVIARGIGRSTIFADEADRVVFLDYLGLVLKDSTMTCFAWSLMANHVHLLTRTGPRPLGHVMQRVLTRYALHHNKRHRRPGHLFQNRYKAILCEADPYFLELVRYIHLNPVRAGVVKDVRALSEYRWTGHQTILGTDPVDWQDTDEVLGMMGGKAALARERYVAFLADGMKHPASQLLEGGGLLRSAGGLGGLSTSRDQGGKMQADERILGSGEFVARTLATLDEGDRRRTWKEGRPTPLDIIRRSAILNGVSIEEIQSHLKKPAVVRARRLACKWLVRDLGLSGRAVARLLKISNTVVSRSAAEGVAVERALDARIE